MKKCDLCGKTLPAGRKRFCCNKHKDSYHNLHNPRGIYAHLGSSEFRSRHRDDDDHPFSGEGLGQWND